MPERLGDFVAKRPRVSYNDAEMSHRETKITTLLLISVGAFAALLSGCGAERQGDGEVVIFAAASLRDAMQSISAPFEEQSGVRTVFNFAGSNVLAQQIEAATAADVYLSANEQWMDYLEKAGRIEIDTRRTFASNSLVVIAHRSKPLQLDDPARLDELDFRFLSLADPEAVPAGRYARQYLQSLDANGELWNRLSQRVAPAPDVRAALAVVEADPEILGIVYSTDAAFSQEVKVIYQVPRQQGPDIRYSAALVRDAPHAEAGRRFLEFLAGPRAMRMLQAMGFGFAAAE